MSADLPIVTHQAKLAELKREIALRERVYPDWVQAGRLQRHEARRRIAVLKAIAEDYQNWLFGCTIDEARQRAQAGRP